MMNRLKLKVFVFLFVLQASTYLNAAVVVSSSAPDFASAQRIGNLDFSLVFNGNVLDSGTIPHVQIIQTGRATSGFDFYRFSHGGGLVHLDVDSTPTTTNFDTMFGIWDGDGNILMSNDDSFGDPGDIPGVSVGGRYNSNLSYLDLPNGEYVVGVGRYFSQFANGGSIFGPEIPIGGTYTLNISSANVPEPTSMATLSLASVFLLGRLKRLRKKLVR